MTWADRIGFDPSLPWPMLAGLAALALLAVLAYAFMGGRAPITRALGLALVLAGLAQPMIVREAREPMRDIVAVVVDASQSLDLAGRDEAAQAAAARLIAELERDETLEVRVREAAGGPDGTPLVRALEDALADAPRDRIAGAILLTDGQINDVPADPRALVPLGPVHALIVGDPARGDRRLELLSAPAFGIVGEPAPVEAIVHDPTEGSVRVRALVDGQTVREATVPANQPFTMTLRTPKRGANLVVLEAAEGPQEIALANNRGAFQLAGVRDRLRVLLVTGEPHSGARVWRNFLKSDPSVDLVHFTILRPPDKFDATPREELSLIEFPTRELFVEKIDQFDLIIFDRYRQRGILNAAYFDQIARRVEAGGALLIAAGPYDVGPESIFRTPLAAVLPSSPTDAVLENPFRPSPTTLGRRHPVLRGLPAPESWGRWTRAVAAESATGKILLTGPGGSPLLVLDRAGQGRVAQLWSDQVWLWARGYDGGGPHGEFLRRLAHWLMQEPELEDERLTLAAAPEGLVIERATLADTAEEVELIDPLGRRTRHRLSAAEPGLFRAIAPAEEPGVWEARAGRLRAFAAIGAYNSKEAAELVARTESLQPLAQATGGSVRALGETAAPLPDVRRVGSLEGASGADWIGLRRREGYVVRASAAEPLGPGAAWAAAGLLLLMVGWRREGR